MKEIIPARDLKPLDKYPDFVMQWGTQYANKILEDRDFSEDVHAYIQKAAKDLTRRIYHFTTLSLVPSKMKGGTMREVPRNIKSAPLMQTLQKQHEDEWHAGKNPAWKPKLRQAEILLQRFKTACTYIEKGIPTVRGGTIPGIGDIATMQDALNDAYSR